MLFHLDDPALHSSTTHPSKNKRRGNGYRDHGTHQGVSHQHRQPTESRPHTEGEPPTEGGPHTESGQPPSESWPTLGDSLLDNHVKPRDSGLILTIVYHLKM